MAIISWANQSNKPLNSLSALDNHRKMRKSYDGSLVIWLQKKSLIEKLFYFLVNFIGVALFWFLRHH